MDMCSGTVFTFLLAVILCFILFFVVFMILIYLGYVDFNFPRKSRQRYKILGRFKDTNKKSRFCVLHERDKRCEQQGRHLKSLEVSQENFPSLQPNFKKDKEDKEKALTRQNTLMSNRLGGNLNTALLSEQTSHFEIGAQFAKLYNCQWKHAYSSTATLYGRAIQEPSIIKLLLDSLEQCFIICKVQADTQLAFMNENVSLISSHIVSNAMNLQKELMKRIKEERKVYAKGGVPAYHEVLPQVKRYFEQLHTKADFLDTPELETFIKDCLKLCWLMVVQDPPVTLVFRPVGNATKEFNVYRHSGNIPAFIVWPAVLAEEKGVILKKGVAEFCK